MKVKEALITAFCFLLLSFASGCATFKEMVRQRGEAMDACQPCPFSQGRMVPCAKNDLEAK
ncbi:MAG: hypothetical protein A2117_01455 [Candidatus Wildermuthbacteria bacterium GWA2_46_15]|uniref:Lipoprotein n=1 Tax=Candidatus Wildermuthbacteria bacterium GWA2_46_15 TaxID=1802443 RepID=A0A1G2QRZ3_9BACT|nr:MAG: hypothetical protein A2117_01455 [Candidatus Wildermuthbacteria bacterium GWA2_46_15]